MFKYLFIWIAAISLAILSGSTALSSISKTKAPEIALPLFPMSGFAAQSMASRLTMASIVKNKGNYPDLANPAWTKMAIQAFVSEPITPDAIAVLSLSRNGDVRRELMEKAFALSRRQKLVTGWLIADSGKRNELSGLLGYYDTLLRISSSANSVVVPVMAKSLADDSSIAPFNGLLSKNPPWMYRFWGEVARTPEALGNAVQLRKALYKADESTEDYSDQNLIRALVREKQFGNAEELFSLLSQESANNTIIKNGNFNHEPQFPPLDWELFSTGEYGATVTNERLQISAIAGSGGRFARQLVRLPADVIKSDARFVAKIPDDAQMEMKLSCAETIANPPLPVRLPLAHQIENHQISNKASGCNYFWLDIIGRASENGDGFDIVINSVSFRPNDE